MRIFNGKLFGSTVGGIFQGNITNLNILAHHLIIKPESETTEYDFQIISPDDELIFERTTEVGTMSDLEQIPFLGTYTFKILNATKDEAFRISIMGREE